MQSARRYCDQFAADLGLDPQRLAEGILQIANANMERAIRAVSIQRGYDPRDFALLAFGGAGGMHACEVAESMDIDTVLIPRHAGVLSALGMLLANARKDYSRTILSPSSTLPVESLETLFAPLTTQASADLVSEGFMEADIVIECQFDVRYRGQAYEIPVQATADFEKVFHHRHETLYGYSDSSRPTEVVNLRVNAIGITRKYKLPEAEAATTTLPSPIHRTQARFLGQWYATPVYRREDLPAGVNGVGPAIFAGGEATIVIPPNFRFRIDGVETVIATRIRTISPSLGTEAK